jgi:hypothetical protein
MRNYFLPVMTVLTVIAGAVGLQLGETTIAQIDPLYFQGPAPKPIDVSHAPRAAQSPGYVQASGWAEGYAARAEECVDCPAPGATAPASYAREPLPDVSAALAEPRFDRPAEDLAAEELAVERSAEAQRVRRYVDYPVTADQARIRAALDGVREEPAPEGF